jgi:hypothetical protein
MHSRLLQACATAYVHDRSMLAGVRRLLTKQSRADHRGKCSRQSTPNNKVDYQALYPS